MRFAQPAVSAVDQDCSSNDMRPVCDHGRPYQPPKRNLRQVVARLLNSARRYHGWRQYIRAEGCVLNTTFRVPVPRGCLSVLTAASEKFGLKLAWRHYGALSDSARLLQASIQRGFYLSRRGGRSGLSLPALNHRYLRVSALAEPVRQQTRIRRHGSLAG
jgi:hypothetical protein